MATRRLERATLLLKWSMALLLAVNVAVIADLVL
jgi:hypothetical protein